MVATRLTVCKTQSLNFVVSVYKCINTNFDFFSHWLYCYTGNFNKAWHEKIEIESTDNESIVNDNNLFKQNKKKKIMDSSDSSENEGKYLLLLLNY